MSDSYGDKFETPIIITMLVVIVLSLVGAFALQGLKPDCVRADQNYCEAEPAHH